MSIDKKDPAFPTEYSSRDYGLVGLTIRDWFAGQALAIFACVDDGQYSSCDRERGLPEQNAKWIATAAYRVADAMIEEANKP